MERSTPRVARSTRTSNNIQSFINRYLRFDGGSGVHTSTIRDAWRTFNCSTDGKVKLYEAIQKMHPDVRHYGSMFYNVKILIVCMGTPEEQEQRAHERDLAYIKSDAEIEMHRIDSQLELDKMRITFQIQELALQQSRVALEMAKLQYAGQAARPVAVVEPAVVLDTPDHVDTIVDSDPTVAPIETCLKPTVAPTEDEIPKPRETSRVIVDSDNEYESDDDDMPVNSLSIMATMSRAINVPLAVLKNCSSDIVIEDDDDEEYDPEEYEGPMDKAMVDLLESCKDEGPLDPCELFARMTAQINKKNEESYRLDEEIARKEAYENSPAARADYSAAYMDESSE